jgi:hypothetical protein
MPNGEVDLGVGGGVASGFSSRFEVLKKKYSARDGEKKAIKTVF